MQRDGGPGGAGGAGNPVGGSFTGPAEALEISGDFAYAFSGLQGISTSDVTSFDFTTGNYLFKGEITMSSGVNTAAVLDGTQQIFTLALNGADVMYFKISSNPENMPTTITLPIILPSYTEVSLKVISNSTSALYLTSANIAGRIYRG